MSKIEFKHETADELLKTHSGEFDFVAANILHNVLAEIMGDLKALMKNGAYMVLSGILDEKKQVVFEAIEAHGLHSVETLKQENWIAIVVRK